MHLLSRRALAIAALGVALFWCSLPASAQFLGPNPYLSFSDSPFASTNFSGGYFFLEDFEDGFLNTPGVTSVGGVVNGPGLLTDSVDADDGAIDGSGLTGHSFFGDGANGITFNFDAGTLGTLPTHVGIVWTDGATFNIVTFEAFNAAHNSLGTLVGNNLGDGHFFGGTSEDRFFGLISKQGIASIHITSVGTAGSSGSGIEVDHLQYGLAPVPEASSVVSLGLLLLLGLGGVAVSRRRKAGAAR